MIKIELWKSIKDYPEYEVSDKGNIKSYKNCTPQLMTPCPSTRGHLVVRLSKDKKAHTIYVHKLVLEAFIGKCPQGCCTNHIDGNPKNNEVGNLEWVTPYENVAHSFKLGMRSHVGMRHPRAKLKDGEVWLIKRLLFHKIWKKMICKMFKIKPSHLYWISSGRTWSHIRYDQN